MRRDASHQYGVMAGFLPPPGVLTLFVGQRTTLVELALRHRIPLIADQPSFARAGAIYGINRSWPFCRLAIRQISDLP